MSNCSTALCWTFSILDAKNCLSVVIFVKTLSVLPYGNTSLKLAESPPKWRYHDDLSLSTSRYRSIRLINSPKVAAFGIIFVQFCAFSNSKLSAEHVRCSERTEDAQGVNVCSRNRFPVPFASHIWRGFDWPVERYKTVRHRKVRYTAKEYSSVN